MAAFFFVGLVSLSLTFNHHAINPLRVAAHFQPRALLTTRSRALVTLSVPESPAEQPRSYEEAEKLGLALFAAGDFEGAMRRFEESKRLPGAGYDVIRISPGSQTPGDKSQPPNPRGLQAMRFASPAQLVIADYNIACTKLKLGDKEGALELLRAFATSVENPERQFERMLADPDLEELRTDLRAMAAELKTSARWNPLASVKKMFDVPFVEWKK